MPTPVTVRQHITDCAQAMTAASVHFGHGTDNAHDEACWLVAHVLGLPPDFGPEALATPVLPAQQSHIRALLEERIRTRTPLAYLIGEAWFAGLKFKVTPDVLIPRSPIAELIDQGFSPWLDIARCRHIADVGTGSGCLAIACAHYFPHTAADALDISPAALAVARENAALHGVDKRVRMLESDVLSAVPGQRYDLIVSNPPYVPDASMRELPDEYRHEPDGALRADDDGLAVVLRLLEQVPAHLNPGGILVVEVGEAQPALEARRPDLPFTWLEFEHGGEGVFLLEASQLAGQPGA